MENEINVTSGNGTVLNFTNCIFVCGAIPMPDFTGLHTAPTTRTSGISAQAIAAGANYLGSEIANEANLDTEAVVVLQFASGSTPSAGKSLELYILYDADGTYEEGDATPIDPIKMPFAVIPLPEDTATHRDVIYVSLLPHDLKLLVKSESDQSVTVTVTIKTHNPHLTQDA